MNRKSFFLVVASGLFLACGSHGFLRDVGSFFSAFIRDPDHVGSVIPSSRFVSRAIVRQIECRGEPVKILELGAGTGPVTAEIIKKMRDEDSLDVIEINPEFCKILQKKFGHHQNVHIHCVSVLDWSSCYAYDFILSVLPHNVFKAGFVRDVLEKYKELIKPGGILSYIEYLYLPKIKKVFLQGQKKVDFLETVSVTARFKEFFLLETETVLLNIPPAHVYHLQITKERTS